MNRELLNKILSNEQKSAGLYLEEDDHNLYLRKKGELLQVAVFSSHATIETIQQEAHQIIQSMRNGVSFERVKCPFSSYPCEKETCQGCAIRQEAMNKINADIVEGVRAMWNERADRPDGMRM